MQWPAKIHSVAQHRLGGKHKGQAGRIHQCTPAGYDSWIPAPTPVGKFADLYMSSSAAHSPLAVAVDLTAVVGRPFLQAPQPWYSLLLWPLSVACAALAAW